ncbi:MAG: T9SS type A sorting domain-containing protein [Vicingaceae bacterium]|nr:T9SS type A sorting domain-containing protein [Vicingaceae bacterium]
MKKSLLSIITLTILSFGVTAQNVNIPDANFKTYLLGNPSININSDTEIQVSEATAFTGQIDCSNDGIIDMTGVEAFTSLDHLRCANNSISSIDLSQNVSLTILQISSNLLTNLDVSQNINLVQLLIADNNFTSIDLSQNINLTRLVIQDNNFTSIDLSQNTALTEFTAHNNNLISLDVSNNSSLVKLYCLQNNLSSLNMKNVSTTTLNNFYATSNPNLTCIQVDNVANASASWTNIDAVASYSLDCNYLVNTISVQGQGGQSTIATLGGSLQMDAGVLPTYANDTTYTWSVTSVTGYALIDNNGLLTAQTDGTVKVVATANDGSGVSGDVVVTISNQSNVGVYEQALKNNILVYPNPTKGNVTIDLSVFKKSNISVISSIGKEVFKATNVTQNKLEISLIEFSNGIYFVQIQHRDKIVTQRIVKQ